jgi:hypothetical protein
VAIRVSAETPTSTPMVPSPPTKPPDYSGVPFLTRENILRGSPHSDSNPFDAILPCRSRVS